MRSIKIPSALALIYVGLLAPTAFPASISLQDFAVNVNGTTADYNNLADPDPTMLTFGMNAAGFNTTTGLGSITYSFSGAPGSYFVNFYFDLSASAPFFNEYGAVNGAAPAGTSFEIAEVNPSVGGIQFFNGTNESFANVLDDTNHVPVGNTNFLNNCTVKPCNGDVAMALGFNFTLTSGQSAVITLGTSATNPGGFNLEDIHPVDPANAAAAAIFLNGSISVGGSGPPPPPPSAPEPGSLPLLATIAAIAAAVAYRRKLGSRTEGTTEA